MKTGVFASLLMILAFVASTQDLMPEINQNNWLTKYISGENHDELVSSKQFNIPTESPPSIITADHSRSINPDNFAFPNGKLKCLVMSFDDGPEHDRVLLEKLNEARIIGTFHFNSARLGKKADWLSSQLGYDVQFVTESEVRTIYTGHEISGHTANHLGLSNQSDSIVKFEVASDREALNVLLPTTKQKSVEGLAYPFGDYDKQVIKTLEAIGIKYARTTASTHNFELPDGNFLALHPTCHVFEAPAIGAHFVKGAPSKMQVLHVWGHSYEFHDNWALADTICNVLGKQEDIWYAQTIELVDYLTAIGELIYDDGTVFNPSESITVWIRNENGDIVELKPGKRMAIHFKSSYASVDEQERLYPPASTIIRYHSEWTRHHYQERVATFKKAPLNFGDIVFIGNSITEQGGNWGERIDRDNVKNRGIAGDVTDGVLKRLDELTYYKPTTVFLLIGINDLFNLHYQKEIPSTAYIANNIVRITDIIHERSPETTIYLQTVLPTSEAYMMTKIEEVNTIIKAKEHEANYKVIDLFAAFVGADGLIQPDLTSDGTHLSELGYRLWGDMVSTILNEK